MRRRWLLATTLLLVAGTGVTAWAQIREEPTDLIIRVFFSNDRMAADQVRVQLLSYGVPVDDQFTDSTGQVTFHQLRPGTYRVRMSGNNLEETTSDNIYLDGREPMHTEMVHVQLKPAADAAQSAPGGPPVSAVELNIPDNARKEFEAGNAELGKKNLDAARKHYEKATQLYPQYAWAFNNLGIIAMQQKNPVEAHNYFQRSVEADDHYANGYFNLGKLMAMEKKYSDADTLLSKAQGLDPMNVEILLWLSNVELVEGKYDLVVQACKRANSLQHEKVPAIHIIAARAFEAEHDLNDAATEYTAYLKEAANGPYAKSAKDSLANIARQSH